MRTKIQEMLEEGMMVVRARGKSRTSKHQTRGGFYAFLLVVIQYLLARTQRRHILEFLGRWHVCDAVPPCVSVNVAAAVDVLSCAIAPNGPVVVGVATAAVVLETDIFVGALSDLVEVVFWAVVHTPTTAVVYVEYSIVQGVTFPNNNGKSGNVLKQGFADNPITGT